MMGFFTRSKARKRGGSDRPRGNLDVRLSARDRAAPAQAPAGRTGADAPTRQSRNRVPRKKRRRTSRPLRFRARRLLGIRPLPVGRDREHRARGLDRRPSAGDPVAGSAQAPAVDPDRGARRPRACDARRFRRRGVAQGIAETRAAGLPRDRGPALLRPSWRRSDGHRTRAGRQRHAPRRFAGRLDDHAAAREEPVPHAGPDLHAQNPGSSFWRCGWSENSPRTRSSISISTASISAPAPMASRPPRSAISASRPSSSISRKPRCSPASSNRRRALRRRAIPTAPSGARKSC